MKVFFTPPELAKRLGVKPDKVLDWIHSGDLVASNLATKANGQRPRWRISQTELDKFLLSRQQASEETAPAA